MTGGMRKEGVYYSDNPEYTNLIKLAHSGQLSRNDVLKKDLPEKLKNWLLDIIDINNSVRGIVYGDKN